MLSIISGVASKLPGRAPYSGSGISLGSHCQAISRSPTLVLSMSASAECFVWDCSAPTYGHSTMRPVSSWAESRAVEAAIASAHSRFMRVSPSGWKARSYYSGPWSLRRGTGLSGDVGGPARRGHGAVEIRYRSGQRE